MPASDVTKQLVRLPGADCCTAESLTEQPTHGSRPYRVILLATAMLAAVLLGFSSVQAATKTWVPTTAPGDWNLATNWSPAGLPAAGDDVIIPSGTGSVTISASDITVASLTVNRPISVNQNRTLFVGTANINAQVTLAPGSLLSGGVYNIGAGGGFTFPVPCNLARFRNIAINGTLALNGGGVRWENTTLQGELRVTGQRNTIVFDGNSTIDFRLLVAPGAVLAIEQHSVGTLTISPSGEIRGGTITFGTLCWRPPTAIINYGTIVAEAGGAITTAPNSPFSNFGTIDATAGPVTLGGASANPLGGTLIGPNFTFGGVFDLGGESWNLRGRPYTFTGAIQNGTIDVTDTTIKLARLSNAESPLLANLTVIGDLELNSSGVRWNNVTLTGNLRLAGTGGTLQFIGDQTLSCPVVSIGETALYLYQFSPGTLTIGSGTVFTNIQLLIGVGSLPGQMRLVNNGTINASLANTFLFSSVQIDVPLVNNGVIAGGIGSISIPSGLVNTGTVAAGAGGLTIGGAVSNTGTISSQSGAVRIDGTYNPLVGIYTGQRFTFGGVANLAGGTWDLSGRTVVIAGTVQNGTINRGDGTVTFQRGGCSFAQLVNIAFNGNLDLTDDRLALIGSTLNGAVFVSENEFAVLGFSAGSTINFPITVAPTGHLLIQTMNAGTLTVGAASVIQGGTIDFSYNCEAVSYSVINNGTITAGTPGTRVEFIIPVTNRGRMVSTGGSLVFNESLTNSGSLEAPTGRISINGSFNPLGGVLLGGNFAFGGTIDLGGGTWDLSGQAFNFGATVRNGTINVTGSTLTFLTACRSTQLTNLIINGDLNIASASMRWTNVTMNGSLTVTDGEALIAFDGDTTLSTQMTSGPGGTLRLQQATDGTMTIAPTGILRGGNIYLGYNCAGSPAAMSVINNGAIIATTPDRPITFDSAVRLVNNALVSGGAGKILFDGGLTNNGTATTTTGTIEISQAFNPLIGTLTGGTFVIRGTVDLAGLPWHISGYECQIAGALRNGTVSSESGTVHLSNAAVSDVTINADVLLRAALFTNVVLNGAMSVDPLNNGFPSGQSRLQFDRSATIDFPITVNSGGSLIVNLANPGTLTIAAPTVLRGSEFLFGLDGPGAMTVINNGTVRSERPLSSTQFFCPVTNNGTITATDINSSVTFRAATVNNGVLSAEVGRISIDTAFNPLVGTLLGSRFTFSGLIDLAGATWNINDGSYRFNNTLRNGTVNLTTAVLRFGSSSCALATVSNIRFNGDFNLVDSYLRWQTNVLVGSMNISGSASVVGFDGDNTVSFPIAVNTTGITTIGQASAGRLTIAPGATISGGNLTLGQTCASTVGGTVVNNGIINANLTGRTITFAASTPLTNNGTINAGPGTLAFNGSLINAGTINSVAGATTFSGPFNPTLGTLNGDNATFANIIDLAGGVWNLAGRSYIFSGRIQNGTLNLTGGMLTFGALPPCFAAEFRSLSVIGDVLLNGGSLLLNAVSVNGSIRATGTAINRLWFQANSTVNYPIIVDSAGGLFIEQYLAGTLTITPTGSIRGGAITIGPSCGNYQSQIVNNGVIEANVPGKNILITSTRVTNNGTLSATAADLTVSAFFAVQNYNATTRTLTDGTWKATNGRKLKLATLSNSTIRTIAASTTIELDGAASAITNNSNADALGDTNTILGRLLLANRPTALTPNGGTLVSSGTLTLDRSTLSITGAFTQASGGTLAIGLGGTSLGSGSDSYGRIVASTNATLAGTLQARLLAGFVPSSSDIFSAISAQATAGVFGATPAADGFVVIPTYSASGVSLSLAPCLRLEASPADVSVCQNQTASFSVLVSGALLPSYSWQWRPAGSTSWQALSDGLVTELGSVIGSQTATLQVTEPRTSGVAVRAIATTSCTTLQSEIATLTLVNCACSLADVAGGGADGLAFDGIIDGSDFIAFINSFAAGDPEIDALADVAGGGNDGLSPDGIIDGSDFVAFINSFAAGC